MTLAEVLEGLIVREGGYVDHPSDKGGPTCWGITEGTARAFGYTGDMQRLTREMALQIYRDRYWIQPGLNDVARINISIAEELLDTGVNMGPQAAGIFLQRALNVLNMVGGADQKLFPNLAVDGNLGKLTLFALQKFIMARGHAGISVLLKMLNAQQSVRYIELAEKNLSQEDFEFGWQANRVS